MKYIIKQNGSITFVQTSLQNGVINFTNGKITFL